MTFELSAVVAERDVDVAFEVADGETLAVLGPNGSGKSTALAVTAGLVAPNPGRVVLAGRVLTDIGPGRPGTRVPPHARRTALLGQEPLLFPHLDALENVAFGPRSTGTPRSSARRDAQRWLDEVGVGELAGRRPSQLSGGQAQRVAVARALAAEPALLLLDEPLAALDVAVLPALRQTLRRVLADRTAIVVTHDPLDALLLADRVVVLVGRPGGRAGHERGGAVPAAEPVRRAAGRAQPGRRHLAGRRRRDEPTGCGCTAWSRASRRRRGRARSRRSGPRRWPSSATRSRAARATPSR